MSTFSKNPFALLGGEDDEPQQTAKPIVNKKTESAPGVPKAAAGGRTGGAAAAGAGGAGGRGGQRKGGNRNNNTTDSGEVSSGLNSDVPTEGSAPKGQRGTNREGPRQRGGRGAANPRNNAGTYAGGDRPRREKGGPRALDRQSQTGRTDSHKAETAGWGADDGEKELQAETLAEEDAAKDVSGWDSAPVDSNANADAPAKQQAAAAEEEEEDNTQTYEEYLASRAKDLAVNVPALPEARKINEDDEGTQWASTVIRQSHTADEADEWFLGKAKEQKQRKQKEGKQRLDVDIQYAKPARTDRGPPREGGRGGRGGGGARGGARGGGGRGGARGGAGAGRGGARGGGRPANGNDGSGRDAMISVDDSSAFPAL